uniref:Uncharacterized protein n=1 Tax=Palpitomonas bilix TaxID=652834 RepID=A0A7S3DIH1_9EUKA
MVKPRQFVMSMRVFFLVAAVACALCGLGWGKQSAASTGAYTTVRSTRATYGDVPQLADFTQLPLLNASNPVWNSFGWAGEGEVRAGSGGKETFLLLTPSGLYRLESDSLDMFPLLFVDGDEPTLSPSARILTHVRDGRSVLGVVDGTSAQAYFCGNHLEQACEKQGEGINFGEIGTANDAAVSSKQDLLVVGGSDGAMVYDLASNSAYYVSIKESVRCVAVRDEDGSIALSGSQRVWFHEGRVEMEKGGAKSSPSPVDPFTPSSKWRFEWIADREGGGDAAGPVEDPPRSLLFSASGTLWIPNENTINYRRQDGTFGRFSFMKGLPLMNASVASNAVAFGGVAIALKEGMGVFPESFVTEVDETVSDVDDTILHLVHPFFYRGNRYLSTDSIVSALAVVRERMLVVTTSGLAVMRLERTTLEEKSRYYTEIGEKRHNRFGTMNDCSLAVYGDASSCRQGPGANDGLWTSMYLGGKIFEYAITKDEATRQICWERFKGLKTLVDVTGIRGLMARSAVNTNEGEAVPQGNNWHASPTMPGWWWQGDTSSDEVVGHLFVYPLMHDIVCENEEERSVVKSLLDEVTSQIVMNGFYLIDVTGNYTTWGRWSPTYLNDYHLYADNRGLYSLEILAWLKSAHRITGRSLYADAYANLTSNFGYEDNLLNLKVIDPQDDNFSDDELAYLSYFAYCWAVPPSDRPSQFDISLRRQWESNMGERSALWISMHNFCAGKKEKIEDGVWNLQGWPEELIDWPMINSDRYDVLLSKSGGRSPGHEYSVDVLRPQERSQLRWNGNPHEVDNGGGHTEGDPGAWILPYWLGRYQDLWQ